MADRECLQHLGDAVCSVAFARCHYSTCDLDPPLLEAGQACSIAHHLTAWEDCGRRVATLQGHHGKLDAASTMLSFLNLMDEHSFQVMSTAKERMRFAFALNVSIDVANKYGRSLSVRSININNCSMMWRHEQDAANTTTSPVLSDDQRRVGCDPNRRTYTRPGRRVSYDSSHVMALCLIGLSVFVATASHQHQSRPKNTPTIRFVDVRDALSRAASVVLGMLVSFFMFLAGQNLEGRAVDLIDNDDATTMSLTLYVWAIFNYAACWLCMHHAAFLLVSGPDVDHALVAFCRTKCKCADRGMSVLHSFTKGDGKHFALFMIARELCETVVQFVGIETTAQTRDVDLVLARVAVVSLNLILLPVASAVAFRVGGVAAAKLTFVLLESVFDQVFITIAVLLQLGSNASAALEDHQGFWGQLGESLPSLLPAVLFCIADQTPLMMLAAAASDAERRYQQRQRHAAARKIQALVRLRKHGDKNEARRAPGAPRRASRRWSVVLQQVLVQSSVRIRVEMAMLGYGASFLGSVAVMLGVALWWHVAATVKQQETRCVYQVGGIATCFKPRIYFLGAGVFGKPGCHFQNVTEANCSGSLQVKEADLPAAEEVYREMRLLERIDLSGLRTANLIEVPSSWGAIPNLRQLDLSGNPKFARLPFRVCQMTSLRKLRLDGTIAARSLDWSREINVTGAPPYPQMSDACTEALADTLETLRLSRNNISLGVGPANLSTYSPYHSDFSCSRYGSADLSEIDSLFNIRKLRKLSRLDLNDNRIRTLGVEYFEKVYDPNRPNSVVELLGNPINAVTFLGVEPAYAAGVMQQLRESTTADVRCLEGAGSLPHGPHGGLDAAYFTGLGDELEYVRLFDNNLSATGIEPNTFAGLGGTLRRLFLFRNHLAHVNPKWFEGLSVLVELALYGNDFTSIDAGVFSDLRRLTDLTLQNNQLTLVHPQAFAGLANLDWLRLDHNLLTEIDATTFSATPRVQHLTLDHNRLTGFDRATFRGLNKLKGLQLNNNCVRAIKNGTFEGLESLLWLYLNDNELTVLESNVFAGMTSLRELRLNDNKLESIQANAFAGLPSLTDLVIYNGNNLGDNALNSSEARVAVGLRDAVNVR